ncbi:hypothetical protein Bca4012_026044 [Brassica carinata]|uniref:Retrotransposon gag domain-containing protein n=1 Tax=Brassica carinata TaxID=52824 RepID=A0A8X7VHY5_BRACI|nr:hypothetical protein Bca52824_023141 [Brassica carinata]
MVDTTQFRNKEVETASLKSPLKDLQRSLESRIHNQRQKDSYFNPFGSTSSEVPMYQGSYSPGFLSDYQTQKIRSPLPGFLSSDEVFTSRYGSTSIFDEKPKQARSKPRRQKGSEFQINPPKRRTLTPSSSHDSVDNKGKGIAIIEFSMTSLLDGPGKSTEVSKKDPQENIQFSPPQPMVNIRHFSETSSSEYDTNSEEESLPKQFAIGEESTTSKKEPSINEIYSSDEEMNYAAPREEIPNKRFYSKVMVFTFDDIPFENGMIDWMNSEATTSPLHLVIQQFTATLSGTLKEWWNSLGEYRQQQVYQTTIPLLLGEIHREFIDTPTHQNEQVQEEFFSAKCCSLKKKDLAKHFERQTRRYYALNGLNNTSLKHVYLSSIDDYLS